MQSISPVFTEQDTPHERVVALDQPQYEPIIILPLRFKDGSTALCVRFSLSHQERQAIANGADLILTQLCEDYQRFTPTKLDLCHPNTEPEWMSQ